MRLPRWLYPVRNFVLRSFTGFMLLLLRVLPERQALELGAFAGRVAYRIQPSWRRTALRNLELLYKHQPAWSRPSPAEMEAIAAQCAVHLGWEAVEFIRMGLHNKEQSLAMVIEEQGESSLRELVAQGKGVLAVGLHFGNWELAGGYIASRIAPLYAVGKAQRDQYFTRLAFKWRQRYGIHNIFAGNRANSDVLRALRNGGILGLVSDQNGGNAGVFAPFCGTMASCSPGAAALALKTGAPLIFVYCQRLAPGRHRFICTDPLDLGGLPKQHDAAMVEAVTRINREAERIILGDPAQWLLGHKRWRTRPPGEPPLY